MFGDQEVYKPTVITAVYRTVLKCVDAIGLTYVSEIMEMVLTVRNVSCKNEECM